VRLSGTDALCEDTQGEDRQANHGHRHFGINRKKFHISTADNSATSIHPQKKKKKKKKRYNIAIQMAAVNFTSVGYFTQNCHIKIQ